MTRFKFKNAIITLLLLSLVSLTIWEIVRLDKEAAHHFPSYPHKPDFFVYGINVHNFAKDGTLISVLSSPKLTYYNSDDMTYFKMPRIILYSHNTSKKHTPRKNAKSPQNKNPWHITANKGVAKKNRNTITLIGNVILKQKAGANNPSITLRTSTLTLNVKQKIAHTKAPVKLVEVGNDHTKSIVTAVGIKLNQKTGVLQLLSHARAYYQPQSTLKSNKKQPP